MIKYTKWNEKCGFFEEFELEFEPPLTDAEIEEMVEQLFRDITVQSVNIDGKIRYNSFVNPIEYM